MNAVLAAVADGSATVVEASTAAAGGPLYLAPADVEALAETLRRNTVLTTLSLAGCGVDEHGATVLGEALRDGARSALRTLTFSTVALPVQSLRGPQSSDSADSGGDGGGGAEAGGDRRRSAAAAGSDDEGHVRTSRRGGGLASGSSFVERRRAQMLLRKRPASSPGHRRRGGHGQHRGKAGAGASARDVKLAPGTATLADAAFTAALIRDNTVLTGLSMTLDAKGAAQADAQRAAMVLGASCARSSMVTSVTLTAGGFSLPVQQLRGATRDDEVSFISRGLTAPDAAFVAAAMARNRHTRALVLRKNAIGALGAEALGHLLRVNTTLTSLRVADNRIGDAGFAALHTAVAESPSLTDLVVARNRLSAGAVCEFARVLLEASRRPGHRPALRGVRFDAATMPLQRLLRNPTSAGGPGAVLHFEDASGSGGSHGVSADGADGAGTGGSPSKPTGSGFGNPEVDRTTLVRRPATASKHRPRAGPGGATMNEPPRDSTLSFAKDELHLLDMAFVAALVPHNPSILSLVLDNNVFAKLSPRDVMTTMSHVAKVLAANTLKHLSMQHMQLGEERLQVVFDALTHSNTSVTSLAIAGNTLNSRGGIAFGNMLGHNATLTHVSVQQNYLTMGAIQFIGRGLRFAKGLELIRFDQALLPVHDIDGSSGAVTLNLSSRRLSLGDIVFLSCFIPANVRCRHINLSNNTGISAAATEYIAEACRSNYTLETLKLFITDLPVQELMGHTHAPVMSLAGQRLTSVDLSFICEALRHNTVLTDLNLRRAELPTTATSDLSGMLTTNSTLTRLDVSGNDRLSVGSARQFAHALLASEVSALRWLKVHDLELPIRQITGMDPTATSVSLEGAECTSLDAVVISEFLKANAVCRDFSLHKIRTPMLPVDVERLALALKSGPNLTIQSIRFDETHAIPVQGLLGMSTALSAELHSIPGKPLCQADVVFVSTLLKGNESLLTLAFTQGTVGIEQAAPLVEALRTNTVLETLALEILPLPVQQLMGHTDVLGVSLAAPVDEAVLHPIDIWAVSAMLTADTSRTALDLSFNRLSDESAHKLLQALSRPTACPLETLVLTDNALTMDGVRALCDLIRSPTFTTTLTTLRLEDADLPIRDIAGLTRPELHRLSFTSQPYGVTDLVLIGSLVGTNEMVRTLRLRDCNVLASQRDIADALENNGWQDEGCIEHLDLSGNNLGNDVDGFIETVSVLAALPGLVAVDLRGNRIGRGIECIALMLESNSVLTSLNLGGNVIDALGAAQLAAGLANNTTMLMLHMQDCGLSDLAVNTLLSEQSSYTSLDISRNDGTLTAEGLASMVEVLVKRQELQSLRIGRLTLPIPQMVGVTAPEKLIYFKGEHMELAELVVLCQCLSQHNHRVKELDLTGAGVDDDGAAAIAEVLALTTSLTTLTLQGCDIGDTGALVLSDGLSTSVTLKRLDLRDNALGNDGVAYLIAALEENRVLTELDVSGNKHQGTPEGVALDAGLAAALNLNSRFDTKLDIAARTVTHGTRNYPNGDQLVVDTAATSEFVTLGDYWFVGKRSAFDTLTIIASVFVTTVEDWMSVGFFLVVMALGIWSAAGACIVIRAVSTLYISGWLKSIGRTRAVPAQWLGAAGLMEALHMSRDGKLSKHIGAVIDIRDDWPWVGLKFLNTLSLWHAVVQSYAMSVVKVAVLLRGPDGLRLDGAGDSESEEGTSSGSSAAFNFVVLSAAVSIISAALGMTLSDRYYYTQRRVPLTRPLGDESACDRIFPLCKFVDNDVLVLLWFRGSEVLSRVWTWGLFLRVTGPAFAGAVLFSLLAMVMAWTTTFSGIGATVAWLGRDGGANTGRVLFSMLFYWGSTNTWPPFFIGLDESERWEWPWLIGERVFEQVSLCALVVLFEQLGWVEGGARSGGGANSEEATASEWDAAAIAGVLVTASFVLAFAAFFFLTKQDYDLRYKIDSDAKAKERRQKLAAARAKRAERARAYAGAAKAAGGPRGGDDGGTSVGASEYKAGHQAATAAASVDSFDDIDDDVFASSSDDSDLVALAEEEPV